MNYARTQAAYRETAVLGSSPERLVPVLYEHLLVNVRRGTKHLEQGDIDGKFTSLTRASDIVAELLSSLDHDAGGELAGRLSALYGFWLREISTASRDLDARRLDRVAEMVASLMEAWEAAARIVESGETTGAATAEAT